MCANNYLGLAISPGSSGRQRGLTGGVTDSPQYGSCLGTQQIHKDLEAAISRFHGMEDTILYSSCYDANGGVFEPILGG